MQAETLEQAKHAGRMGALVASEHADHVIPEWSVGASILFVDYARDVAQGQPFLTEDVRRWAEDAGWPSPPDRRAWGHVARAMHEVGHVRHAGYGPAKSSNGSPKVLWRLA